MEKRVKKFSFENVSDILSGEQMKHVAGGCGGCVIITCSDGVYQDSSCAGAESFWCEGVTLISCCPC